MSLANSANALRTSVVMCTYNGAAYLERQCDSLLAQSRLPDQLVVADDASSDQTPALIEGFASQCREAGIEVVVRFRKENAGFIENFSNALELATGDVVFLCDQDDIWYPGKLQAVVARFERDPGLSLVFTDARLVNASGEPLGQTLFDALELEPGDWDSLEAGRGFPVLLRRAVVTGATSAFRRGLVEQALPVPVGWIHDEWLATTGSLLGRILPLAESQIDYRQHGGNQIGMRKRSAYSRLADLFLPRNALLHKALERMRGLHARFGEDASAPPQWRALLTDRMAHYERRICVGQRARVARLPLLVSEWRTGRYRIHSNGVSSVLRDLLRAA